MANRSVQSSSIVSRLGAVRFTKLNWYLASAGPEPPHPKSCKMGISRKPSECPDALSAGWGAFKLLYNISTLLLVTRVEGLNNNPV